jgi:hypothetical protein
MISRAAEDFHRLIGPPPTTEKNGGAMSIVEEALIKVRNNDSEHKEIPAIHP